MQLAIGLVNEIKSCVGDLNSINLNDCRHLAHSIPLLVLPDQVEPENENGNNADCEATNHSCKSGGVTRRLACEHYLGPDDVARAVGEQDLHVH